MPGKLDDLVKVFEALAKKKLLVGIPEQGPPAPGKTMTNSHLGYIHEFGSPANNIPPRPFLIPGVQKSRDKVVDLLAGGAVKAIKTGNVNDVDVAMHKAGTIAASSVQQMILDKIPPPLKPATVAARRRRSRGSKYRRKATPQAQRAFIERYEAGVSTMSESPTTPLYDTGNLLRAITYTIRED